MGPDCGMARRITRGEVRLVRFAAPDKERPAVLLTDDRAIQYLNTVTVAPITSTIRGVPSQVILNEEDGMKAPCAINLHNIISLPQHFVGAYIAQLSEDRLREICRAMNLALGCL